MAEKTIKTPNILDLLKEIKEAIRYLNETITNMNEVTAKSLLLHQEESGKIQSSLITIQRLHSLVVAFHPEQVYSFETGTTKEETFYNYLVSISEENKGMIDLAISFFQNRCAIAHKIRLGITRSLCYSLLTQPPSGIETSFQALIFRILSTCNQILPYFEHMDEIEYRKGAVEVKRIKGKEEMSRPPSE